MSTAARHRRTDTDALRQVVSVGAVLRDAGVEAPRERGRCRCPLHAGENPSALSYDPTRWRCFVCEAGGDVYALVMRLRDCDFRQALAVVAELAGLPADGLPTIDRAERERRETIARRRDALRRWRTGRLGEWLALVGQLEHEAERLGRWYAAPERRGDPDRWRLLGSLHDDLARAEMMAALLSTEDEARWAELWLAERRGELLVPEDLR